MRILVEHDQHGTIKSIAAAPSSTSQRSNTTLRARPGHQVTELEAPHVQHDEDHVHLLETKRHYRVELDGQVQRLVRSG